MDPRANQIKLNEMQLKAYNAVISRKNIFITGIAGTGKSAVIKKIKHDMEIIHKINVAITSTTGISANLINGTTLHSYLGIQLGTGSFKKLYKMISTNKKINNRWRRLEVLIIDEVSMLSIKLFEKLERLARAIRCNEQVFGGIQIVLTGDFCQLPPVGEQQFIFESPIWNICIKETVYLRDIMRQSDKTFMRVLSNVRLNNIDDEVKDVLKSREIKYISDTGLIPTMIYSTNAQVDKKNKKYYDKLETKEYTYELKYKWHINVTYKEKYDNLLRFKQDLNLKVGAQVMHLINADGLFNGSRGVIKEFINGIPLVYWVNGMETLVTMATLTIEENDVDVLSYTQIPLKLAFAASCHSQQGSSLDLVRVDCKNFFADGQIYVALSRVRTLEGLYIRNLNLNLIKCNPKAKLYYEALASNEVEAEKK